MFVFTLCHTIMFCLQLGFCSPIGNCVGVYVSPTRNNCLQLGLQNVIASLCIITCNLVLETRLQACNPIAYLQASSLAIRLPKPDCELVLQANTFLCNLPHLHSGLQGLIASVSIFISSQLAFPQIPHSKFAMSHFYFHSASQDP